MSAEPAPVDAEALLQELAEQMRPAVRAQACFVGIYSGGAWLADRLVKLIPGEHPVGYLDVSFYRDDLAQAGFKSNVRRSELPFPIQGADIVLIDDVLYTGRSTRAAINTLFDYGRPRSVELAVLIDRGGRELPIAADYCGGRLIVAETHQLELEQDENGRLRFMLVPRQSKNRAESTQPPTQRPR